MYTMGSSSHTKRSANGVADLSGTTIAANVTVYG